MRRPAPRFVVLLTLGLAASASLLAACGSPEALSPTAPPPTVSPEIWRGEGSLVEVKVHDLHCDGCQGRAEKTLATVVGVASVKADHETDVIRLTLTDPAIRADAIARIRDEIHAQHWQVVGEDPVPPNASD